jgi:hypothetical protein
MKKLLFLRICAFISQVISGSKRVWHWLNKRIHLVQPRWKQKDLLWEKNFVISLVASLPKLFAAHVAGRCPLIMNSVITYSAKVIRTAQLFQHRIPVARYEFLMNLCKKYFHLSWTWPGLFANVCVLLQQRICLNLQEELPTNKRVAQCEAQI